MKATLEFNLPEEQEDMQIAIDAGSIKAALDDVMNQLRRRVKYGLAEHERAMCTEELLEAIYQEAVEAAGEHWL